MLAALLGAVSHELGHLRFLFMPGRCAIVNGGKPTLILMRLSLEEQTVTAG
ncbi:hypothetical protein KCP78_23880 [Salmonella enterica subsp. enterica]|nr:hypothetical protein KCP78_23880 [Salmonella enterica subsp. enterica]